MEVAYKFFVHLEDAETHRLVAQADVMPRDWTYPTVEWEVGEVVPDEISISVSGLPSGEYELWVGAYHPGTGERLYVDGMSSGLSARGNRLMLPEQIAR
jgi:hypothetical protein